MLVLTNSYAHTGPLKTGHVSLAASADLDFEHTFRQPAPFLLFAPTSPTQQIIIIDDRVFKQQFGLPYGGSVRLAYALTSHISLILGYSYLTANRRVDRSTSNGVTRELELEDFKSHTVFIGSYYYFSPVLKKLSPYAGIRAGLMIYPRIDTTLDQLNGTPVTFANGRQSSTYYKAQIGPYGALIIGLTYPLTKNLNIYLESGVEVKDGLHGAGFIPTISHPSIPNVTSGNIGDTGPILSYPLNLGLKYCF